MSVCLFVCPPPSSPLEDVQVYQEEDEYDHDGDKVDKDDNKDNKIDIFFKGLKYFFVIDNNVFFASYVIYMYFFNSKIIVFF